MNELPTIEQRLLPCPHCGGAAHFEEVEERSTHTGSVRFSVGCSGEDCIGWMSVITFARRSDAVDAWNKRYDDATGKVFDESPVPPGYPELCWLIEHKPGVVNLYFTGDHYQNAWTDNPYKALRFPNKHTAEIARNVYWQVQQFGSNHGFNMPDGDAREPVRICEHLWMRT